MTLKFGPARTDSVIIQGICNRFCMLFLENAAEAMCNGSFHIEDLMWFLFFGFPRPDSYTHTLPEEL